MANRLTKENYEDDALHLKGKTQSQYNNELWQYAKEREDIEEKLGIDLITLFKILKNGIWVKTKNGISQHFTISIRKWLQTNIYCLYYRPYTHVWFKDYGKTWALTKEELEHAE